MGLTRREVIGSAALSVATLATTRVGWAAERSTASGPVLSGWSLDQPLARRALQTSFEPEEQVLWSTLMRVDDKLHLPLETWYLWHSTHDYRILRLYTARSPRGPFTEQPPCVLPPTPTYTVTQPAPAAPYTFRFAPGHFQAPDIVWDPVNRMFLGSPHGLRSDRPDASVVAPFGSRLDQASFLICSPDGVNWDYVPTNFTIPNGDRWPGMLAYPGHPDYGFEKPNTKTAGNLDYGRFLRDYNGNLVRTAAGEVVWYYRGLWDNCSHSAAGALVSSDLLTWRKVPGGGTPLYTPAYGRQFAFGSALLVDGYAYLVLAAVHSQNCTDGRLTDPVLSFYMKKSDGPDPLSFSDGPGEFLFHHPSATVATCGSYVVDRVGQHHIAVDARYGNMCARDQAGGCSEQDGVDLFTAAIAPT
jgi:hypothetical protein